MTAALLEKANEELRTAVRRRLEATDPSDEKLVGYKPSPLAGCKPAEEAAAQVLADAWCCEGQRIPTAAEVVERFNPTHPTSQAFYDLCDGLKETHRKKSSDYGSPDDPLANIRNGAKFVGIEPWRAAMVRLSDKVTRLETYCRTGSLSYESFEDTLIDLASYALLTLLTHREARDGSPK